VWLQILPESNAVAAELAQFGTSGSCQLMLVLCYFASAPFALPALKIRGFRVFRGDYTPWLKFWDRLLPATSALALVSCRLSLLRMGGPLKKARIFAIILLLAGLMAACAYLMPEFRDLLVLILYLILGVIGLVVLVLLGGAIWRRFAEKAAPPEAIPTYTHDDEERARFRAMMGVHQPPPKPIRVVKPDADDAPSNGG
jgi:hypothetical protein